MSVLVTGGTGLIGAHLSEILVEKGYRPILFDLYPNTRIISHILDKVILCWANPSQPKAERWGHFAGSWPPTRHRRGSARLSSDGSMPIGTRSGRG
ncbi:MAG: NAD-dependent epimerase/dehydratase family protein [Candidatus Bathyarchaeia archaeon]